MTATKIMQHTVLAFSKSIEFDDEWSWIGFSKKSRSSRYATEAGGTFYVDDSHQYEMDPQSRVYVNAQTAICVPGHTFPG